MVEIYKKQPVKSHKIKPAITIKKTIPKGFSYHFLVEGLVVDIMLLIGAVSVSICLSN